MACVLHHDHVSTDADAYEAVHARLLEVLRGRPGDEEVESRPGWTVHDLVAHLAGLCDDWVEGRLDGYASDGWTATQVARFAHVPLDEVLASWGRALRSFRA